ncbi:MAG: acyl-homoserine lactone acylase PvdQ [Sneathiella sp.]|jgi:acyl-homoserine lactone acylase PvdQ
MKKTSLKRSILACTALAILISWNSAATASYKVFRDEFGVPAIETDDTLEMWFSYGFMQARDRLLQLEILRQEAYGNLLTDEKFLAESDTLVSRQTRNWRRKHLFPDLRNTLTQELSDLPGAYGMREKLTCFAKGIEAFKSLVLLPRAQQDDLSADCISSENLNSLLVAEFGPDKQVPRQEADFLNTKFQSVLYGKDEKKHADFETPWSAIDSMALFQLRVMHEFSLRNTEMKNLTLLNSLIDQNNQNTKVAAQKFNSVKWALLETAKTTIPTTADHVEMAAKQRRQYHQALIENTQPIGKGYSINGCEIQNPETLNGRLEEAVRLASHKTEAPFAMNASNWWVISQENSGNINSLLYNGPQVPAPDPSHTYQVSLTSNQEDDPFRFSGSGFVGTLNFWQGHNETMAFGLTAGNADVSDVFCVSLERKRSDDSWSFQGHPFLPILEGADLKEFQEVATTYQRLFKKELQNIYTLGNTGWPVLTVDENAGGKTATAYILRYNWQGLTAKTIQNWLKATQAKNLNEWNRSLDGVAGNFNLSAAHKDGSIGYRLVGALPKKKGTSFKSDDPKDWQYYPDYDPRLPAPISPFDGWENDGGWVLHGKYNPVTTFHKLSLDQEQAPTASNARIQYIANWNQKPFINMPDTDLDYDSYTPYDRVFILEQEMQGRAEPWTLEALLDFNGRLQRMDVNYFAFKPFLTYLEDQSQRLDEKTIKAISLINRWNGMRGNYRGNDLRGLHKGHVLFYHWLESLNRHIAARLSDNNLDVSMAESDAFLLNFHEEKKDDGGADLSKIQKENLKKWSKSFIGQLEAGQMKLKQPKLNHPGTEIPTIETSHNIHLASRIILQSLHAAFDDERLTISGMSEFPEFSYDKYQFFLLKNATDAKSVMQSALSYALKKTTEDWPEYDSPSAYMERESATYTGLTKTLGAKDTQIGFRPEALNTRHFRNRGAFNMGAALGRYGVDAKNVSSPGIREYRNAPGAGHPTPHNGIETDYSVNQLPLYQANDYRDMK